MFAIRGWAGFLAADRCGISVIYEWCRRAELAPGQEMTWLCRLFVPWLRGRRGQKYRGENFTATDASARLQGIFTFWLLPKTIRSPLDSCTACPDRFPASPSSVTCGEQEPSFSSHLQDWSFIYTSGGCRAVQTTHFHRVFYVYECVKPLYMRSSGQGSE